MLQGNCWLQLYQLTPNQTDKLRYYHSSFLGLSLAPSHECQGVKINVKPNKKPSATVLEEFRFTRCVCWYDPGCLAPWTGWGLCHLLWFSIVCASKSRRRQTQCSFVCGGSADILQLQSTDSNFQESNHNTSARVHSINVRPGGAPRVHESMRVQQQCIHAPPTGYGRNYRRRWNQVDWGPWGLSILWPF